MFNLIEVMENVVIFGLQSLEPPPHPPSLSLHVQEVAGHVLFN